MFTDNHKIVPVVVLKSIDETLPKLRALSAGGINIAEITFRTACAKDAIALAARECPDMLIGAGTVINAEQCRDAVSVGAKFIVSPGFSKEVADVCKESGVPYVPGVVSPTEIMTALGEGISVLKFFPAGAYGGIKTLKALHSAFPSVRFMPTGGVDESNMADYLKEDYIVAIGGSWMMKGEAEDITALSKRAVEIAEGIR